MRKNLLLPIMALMTVVAFSAPSAEAEVYSANATITWVYPSCSLSVAIDTNTDIWTFYYSGSYVIVLPLPGGLAGVFYSIWDDSGYSQSGSIYPTNPTGTLTFTNYTNSGTWAHTIVKWMYVGADYVVIVQDQVDIYTGTQTNTGGFSGGPGGGGGFNHLR